MQRAARVWAIVEQVYNCELNVSMAISWRPERGRVERPTAEYTQRLTEIAIKGTSWKQIVGASQVSGKSSSKSFTLTWTIDFFLWSQWLLLLPLLVAGCWLSYAHAHAPNSWLAAKGKRFQLLQQFFYIYIYISAQLKHGSVSWYWKVCSQVIVIVMVLVAIVVVLGVGVGVVANRRLQHQRDAIAACCSWNCKRQSLLYFCVTLSCLHDGVALAVWPRAGGKETERKIENAHNLAVKDFNRESWKFTLLFRVYFHWFYNWF